MSQSLAIGTKLSENITPLQMLEESGLNWTVEKFPLVANVNGREIASGHTGLIRSSDMKMLDVVTDGWMPVQNQEAFEFFNHWTDDGLMSMDRAGSFRDGRICWMQAKIKEGAFEAVKGDRIESFLLFSNNFLYGKSTTVMTTNIRVTCQNSLLMALSENTSHKVRVSHSNKFDPEIVYETLAISKKNTQEYRERAKHLASKPFNKEQVNEYLNKLFPIGDKAQNKEKTFSKPAQKIFDVIETQPGAKYAEGSFWQLFNAVTYGIDHVLGNSDDTRTVSAWYGLNSVKKQEALKLAVEMA